MPAIKPGHRAIQAYYDAMQAYADLNVEHETGVRTAFIRLLEDTGKTHDWTVITEQGKKVDGRVIRPDATLYKNAMPRGYYEAKDTADDLDAEIRKKVARGYPLTNIIFQDPTQAVLYQRKQPVLRIDPRDPVALAHLLNTYFEYTEPVLESFDQALDQFKENVPRLAEGLKAIIQDAHRANRDFIAAFTAFFELCKTALNPNIRVEAVDEMLIQHLLTERLIRKIFDNPEFTSRNVIAVEIEKVIRALVSHSFDRDEYLRSLDSYYQAIESAAHGLNFTEKQHLLNMVYERFFQGYSVKIADTHGIVYTPQPIVDFMCASVEEVLKTEFGKTLGDKDVVILDPATGTGSFIVNLLRRVSQRDLPEMYRERLFANEIMLLPYYIAALNVEHTYYELTGDYEAFEGLCFVDTLDLAEGRQMGFSFMTEKNTSRVERQKQAPITVIIGNPPYNVGQVNENDNNKNRSYEVIDGQIKETYSRDSKATLKNKLYDPYIRFFRWATNRLQGRDGIVCYVSNNNFVDQMTFDGMRKHLLQDFTTIYHVDLHGNVRENPKLSGTTHNVFGIQVGVGITVAIRLAHDTSHSLHYHRVPEFWRKEEKLAWLTQTEKLSNVNWQPLTPDSHNTWLVPENTQEFASFLSIGSKASKANMGVNSETVFKTYSGGAKTDRDDVVYEFEPAILAHRAERFIENYNAEVDRYKRSSRPSNVDDFVRYPNIKWSLMLKNKLKREKYAKFSADKIRLSLYRPFVKKHLYLDEVLIDAPGLQPLLFPTSNSERENIVIVTSDVSFRANTFSTFAVNCIPELHLCATTDSHQCFPFYVYDEDGSNRRENITDWALAQFREHYGDDAITKWDIFYYVYALLHHLGYREKFADNLKRELPRIPFAPALTPDPSPSGRGESSGFRAFADAGCKLADLHLNYEQVEPWPLNWIETPGERLSYRVEKMRLNRDKTAVTVNHTLTLAGIPPEAFEYRLGNRSALEWVIDQYQVKTDARSGITSDPNRAGDERYIVDLVGRVVRVSVETVRIVNSLPGAFA